MFGAAAVVVAVVIVLVVVLLTRHSAPAPAPPAPSPTPIADLKGTFSKTTMTCPGKKEVVGDTCLITLHLDGTAHVSVTWPGTALVALGIRDAAGKDVGPQVTGEKGNAVFDAKNLKAGDYQLRVVDVTHPADPFDFSVLVT